MSELYRYDSAIHGFEYNAGQLKDVQDAASALNMLSTVVGQMTPADKTTGDSLDDLTLLTENAIAAASKQEIAMQAQTGGNGQPEILIDSESAATALNIATETENGAMSLFNENKISLLKEIRKDIVFESAGRDVTFQLDMRDAGCDGVILKTDFASVRVDLTQYSSGTVEMQGLNEDELMGFTSQPPLELVKGVPVWQLWGVPVVLLLIVVWLATPLRRALKVWVVPVICFLVLAGNAFSAISYVLHTYELNPAVIDDTKPIVACKLTVPDGTKAVLYMPVGKNGSDSMSVFNERNEQQLSKYNPMSDSIMAWVNGSGIYQLADNAVNYADTGDLPQAMQTAIDGLGARGIMTGTTDGMFYPDKSITRAEFVFAVLKAFNLMDGQAQCSFADVKKTDWFYSAAATAQKLKFITGYPDNTFRGTVDIPKDQMIVVTANSLIQYMGYFPPADTNQQLSEFKDRGDIAAWSAQGIAFAAKDDLLIYRSDSRFEPAVPMTRGDAAIVLYKMFSKIW